MLPAAVLARPVMPAIAQERGQEPRRPFPCRLQETLALHTDAQCRVGAVFLFESSWKKPYSDRGVARSSPATPRPRVSLPRSACTPPFTGPDRGVPGRAGSARGSWLKDARPPPGWASPTTAGGAHRPAVLRMPAQVPKISGSSGPPPAAMPDAVGALDAVVQRAPPQAKAWMAAVLAGPAPHGANLPVTLHIHKKVAAVDPAEAAASVPAHAGRNSPAPRVSGCFRSRYRRRRWCRSGCRGTE